MSDVIDKIKAMYMRFSPKCIPVVRKCVQLYIHTSHWLTSCVYHSPLVCTRTCISYMHVCIFRLYVIYIVQVICMYIYDACTCTCTYSVYVCTHMHTRYGYVQCIFIQVGGT